MEILNHEIQPWHLESLNDEEVPKPTDFKGKPLLILFFYLGCPGCTGRAIPFANKMVYEHGDTINVLGIHSNFEGPEYSNDEIIATLKSLHVKFPFFKDAGFATTFHDYQAAGTPHWVLVNKDGTIIRSIFGSDPNRALLWLDYAINEEISN
jgi:peroxiredoxin